MHTAVSESRRGPSPAANFSQLFSAQRETLGLRRRLLHGAHGLVERVPMILMNARRLRFLLLAAVAALAGGRLVFGTLSDSRFYWAENGRGVVEADGWEAHDWLRVESPEGQAEVLRAGADFPSGYCVERVEADRHGLRVHFARSEATEDGGFFLFFPHGGPARDPR